MNINHWCYNSHTRNDVLRVKQVIGVMKVLYVMLRIAQASGFSKCFICDT